MERKEGRKEQASLLFDFGERLKQKTQQSGAACKENGSSNDSSQKVKETA